MSKKIVLVAETGSDITPEVAAEHGICLVPMHVTMGERTLDDGAFPAEEVCAYYDRTGDTPKTSGSVPEDFTTVLDDIHAREPEAQVLHLAYSAVTTCSYHSALLASEGRDYVTSLDTKQVSAGQAAAVLETARWLEEHPDATLEELKAEAEAISVHTHMCFVPMNLDYLRAGGRVSNVVALTGNLLHLHPCIEIIDGYLLAKKKYRGAMEKLVPRLMRDHTEKYNLLRDQVFFICATGLSDEVKAVAEETAREMGFKKITWVKTGCVITSHSGPGAFGMVGFSPRG